ncbi:hypothetical protein KSF_039810 [Reticulibacter mediterranei]|uniref:Uncharacterized protein n=1 Tax=Reticulibacter mediterranei TaxID=2778369 RepID=A0A8J3IHW3_9CHLR|nr:hypothetical protein [Reticulibacter mediterranei]GHO93933.1 hypothetical protein KSF_039810 [Reticulibacter mediterranei]
MNLWTDLDNNLQPPFDLSVQGRTRRLTERVILSSLRSWLLHDYAANYCRSLAATRIFRRCYWVDALGISSKASMIPPAVIETVQPERTSKRRKKDVAPVLLPPALQPIAALSQTLAQESQSFTLYGLLLEAGSSKRRERRAVSNGTMTPHAWTLPKESGILAASWLEAGSALLAGIEQAPAIFLLNPCGPTLFSYDDLASLYQRTVPTELCLLLAHKQIEGHLLAAQRSPTQASALTTLLRSDRWKTLPTQDEERALAVQGFLDLFTASMKRHFLLPVQCIALPMQTRPAFVEEMAYTLIFATRRQDSLLCMNDAVCRNRRRVHEESHRGVLGEEWFTAQLRERTETARQQLYQRTLQLGRAQRLRRWPDLRQQLLLANFGLFTSDDYDAVLRQLLLNREVRCEWRRPPTEGEEMRLPGNEDTLLWL